MGYVEKKIVVCLKSGKPVGTLQSDNIKRKGVPHIIYSDTKRGTVELSSVLFFANYRLEDCK